MVFSLKNKNRIRPICLFTINYPLPKPRDLPQLRPASKATAERQ